MTTWEELVCRCGHKGGDHYKRGQGYCAVCECHQGEYKMAIPKLNPNAAREDLTDRELARLLGGLIGSMIQLADIHDVRNAVRWWADCDQAWVGMRRMKESGSAIEMAERMLR